MSKNSLKYLLLVTKTPSPLFSADARDLTHDQLQKAKQLLKLDVQQHTILPHFVSGTSYVKISVNLSVCA